MVSWVLVLVMNGAYNVKHVTMQEFSSKENCELILSQIRTVQEPVLGFCSAK